MRWCSQEISQFEKSSEYVDTVIIPLFPISFSDEMKEMANMTEYINILTYQIERQLRGRVMLLPGFIYLKSVDINSYVKQLVEFEKELFDHFEYIFYVTADNDWEGVAGKLNGKIIWQPAMQLDRLHESNKSALVEDQVNELLKLFVESWKQLE